MSLAQEIKISLSGIRPLMMDRYPGDNSTSLPVMEKLYLDENKHLVMPAINIYSLLYAENSKSVCRQFFGKNGKTIGLGISSYTYIQPAEIPILDENGGWLIFDQFGKPGVDRFWTDSRVARLKNGIPNPKSRPVINLPWFMSFVIYYSENKYCTLENLRQAFAMGGTLGLGTFRPVFGRYELTAFELS